MEPGSSLRAKRFFVTGGTGFLGTALIERILRSIPDSHVVALIRPGRRSTAAERANREIIKSDCFDRLRREHGDAFNENIARRLTAVQGDVSLDGLGLDEEGLDLLATCDVVVHSAATVNFDSPIDLAVAVNLLGPSRVAATVGIARSRASKSTRRTANRKSSGPAHLIAVSTAYVAGTQQGETDEVLLADDRYTLQVDWKAEVESAERMKADRQAESRRPERLTQFAKEARQELGPAGIHLVAARAEKNREDWVKSELTDAG